LGWLNQTPTFLRWLYKNTIVRQLMLGMWAIVREMMWLALGLLGYDLSG
jgi:hypothetical protein